MRLFSLLVIVLLSFGCAVKVTDQNFLHPRATPLPVLGADIQRRNVELVTADDVKLRGWLLANPTAERTVVFFYGNGQSLLDIEASLYWLAEDIHANVLCFDYRGYGFSDGQPTFAMLAKDALAIHEYAEKTIDNRPGAVVVAGHSLGAVLATLVASQRSVGAALLSAPPLSFADAVENIRRGVPWYKRMWIRLKLDPALSALHPTPQEAIPKLSMPFALILGTKDELVPYESAAGLLERIPIANRFLCNVYGANHNQMGFGQPAVRQCAELFMKKLSLERPKGPLSEQH